MEEPYRRIHAKHRKAVYQTDWHLLNRIRKLISLLGILVLAHTLAMGNFRAFSLATSALVDYDHAPLSDMGICPPKQPPDK